MPLLAKGYGFCITKAVLLAAGARVWGIPSRLGFADVRNHLTSERLRWAMGTDLFIWHGFVELFLEGRWVKATPAFDRFLCEKVGVAPLAFDGTRDSVFQAADVEGNRFMEYVKDRGHYSDRAPGGAAPRPGGGLPQGGGGRRLEPLGALRRRGGRESEAEGVASQRFVSGGAVSTRRRWRESNEVLHDRNPWR